MTLTEVRTARRENRRKMKKASPAVLALCQELEEVLAVMAWKLKNNAA